MEKNSRKPGATRRVVNNAAVEQDSVASDAVEDDFVDNEWYAILESRRLGKRPMTVERLGRRLVLWRDVHGQVVVQDARCPHRGADLGLGRVVDGNLECPYHGFRFAASGSCTLVPCEGRNYSITKGLNVASYPVAEEYGLIWLWWSARGSHSPADSGERPSIPWPDELPASLRGTSTRIMVWNVPFRRAAESMLDLHHAPFAHRRVLPGVGTLLDPYDVEVVKTQGAHPRDLIRTSGVLRHDDGEPYCGKGGLRFGLSVIFPGVVLGEFADRIQFVAAITPIDRDNTWIVYRYYAALPVIGKLVAWLAVWAEDRLVQLDDQRLQESSTPMHFDMRDHRYVPADAGILQWHKLYRARMKAQQAGRHPQLSVLAASSSGAAVHHG
ncbi:MAG: aromatic ring-hydroxylating dioxygenase subunit alpha [Proteobacteria bacterium]|nr:aromatic ring-hydroxylating dioxygenase subunit alpha [Pseudomonadota bacterium]